MSLKTPQSSRTPRKVVRKTTRKPVEPIDLLGRAAVNLDTPELQRFVAGKVIVVTGAGGSIGSEICRQAMRFCPAKLVLVERAENALFEIDRALRERWIGAEIVPMIADITDLTRLQAVFSQHRPDVVFHAAAHKHVPMMEHNPGEAIKNNILGTQNVAEESSKFGVGTFVLISTDKAVNPTSVMGASKRVAEMVVQAQSVLPTRRVVDREQAGLPGALRNDRPLLSMNAPVSRTRFLAVRFGNVLASSGSVVPIFKAQIARGGAGTGAHPDMQRYFMTIPEAAQLVMQAASIGHGGEVFVLDMGQPIRILDLAHRLIRDAGKKPGKDVEIRFSGIRPGEKLFEELCGANDVTLPTSHPRIRVWELPQTDPQQVNTLLQDLSSVIDAPREQVIAALMRAVGEYQPVQGSAPSMRLAAA